MAPDSPDETLLPRAETDDDALVAAGAAGGTRAFRAPLAPSPRLSRAAPRYVPEGRLAAWVFRIAGNLVRAELRRRRVRAWFTGAAEPDIEAVLASLPAPRAFDDAGPLPGAAEPAIEAVLASLPRPICPSSMRVSALHWRRAVRSMTLQLLPERQRLA